MNLNKDDLKEILSELLDARSLEETKEHQEQHEWLSARITAEKLRQDFYREAIKTTIQYSLPVIFSAAIYWVQGHIKL
jgi:hypothetical protein